MIILISKEVVYIKVNRVEQTVIKPSHKMFKVIDDFSIRSNNFYNFANYHIRQEFINNGIFFNYQYMQKEMKITEPYKHLMSQSSQCVLRLLEKNWKSYFVAIKDWQKNPNKYLGMPKLPKYRKKGSNFVWFLKNNQTYIKDGRLYFRLRAMKGYSFKTSVTGRLISVRFVPRNDVFVLEIVYETELKDHQDYNSNVASIDLGVDNFVTMVNNIGLNPVIIKGGIIKSENQWYNKLRSKHVSELPKDVYWSKRLDRISRKRHNRIKNFMHHVSTYIVRYCKINNIDNLIIGRNKRWKQECKLSDRASQNFVSIPYDMLINQLQYKCLDVGLNMKVVEESYTSGTSFIDGEPPTKENYDKERRVVRGSFKSNNGVFINSDVNGAYQICKKVFPNAFESYGIVGCLCPVIIKNVTNTFRSE